KPLAPRPVCVVSSCQEPEELASRHCEERKRRSNPDLLFDPGLLRSARNDGKIDQRTPMPDIHPLAGKPVPASMLANIPRLVTAYFTEKPDPAVASQRVAFGTSGHRGCSLSCSFNEAHILAVSQAVCDHRAAKNLSGPLFVGIDTHALAEPALASALEVFAANGVTVMIDADDGTTPTPVISRAILAYNKGRSGGFADGVVI